MWQHRLLYSTPCTHSNLNPTILRGFQLPTICVGRCFSAVMLFHLRFQACDHQAHSIDLSGSCCACCKRIQLESSSLPLSFMLMLESDSNPSLSLSRLTCSCSLHGCLCFSLSHCLVAITTTHCTVHHHTRVWHGVVFWVGSWTRLTCCGSIGHVQRISVT